MTFMSSKNCILVLLNSDFLVTSSNSQQAMIKKPREQKSSGWGDWLGWSACVGQIDGLSRFCFKLHTVLNNHLFFSSQIKVDCLYITKIKPLIFD